MPEPNRSILWTKASLLQALGLSAEAFEHIPELSIDRVTKGPGQCRPNSLYLRMVRTSRRKSRALSNGASAALVSLAPGGKEVAGCTGRIRLGAGRSRCLCGQPRKVGPV